MKDPRVRVHCQAYACKWNKDSMCNCGSIFVEETATRSLLGDIQMYRRCTSYEESEELADMMERVKKAFNDNPQLFAKAIEEIIKP